MERTALFYATDIIKNATEELKRLSKMSNRNVSNTFAFDWHKCLVAQDGLF